MLNPLVAIEYLKGLPIGSRIPMADQLPDGLELHGSLDVSYRGKSVGLLRFTGSDIIKIGRNQIYPTKMEATTSEIGRAHV